MCMQQSTASEQRDEVLIKLEREKIFNDPNISNKDSNFEIQFQNFLGNLFQVWVFI